MISWDDLRSADGFFARADELVQSEQFLETDWDLVGTRLELVRISQVDDLTVDTADIKGVDVIFCDHRRRLIDDFIKVYPVIFGCVAWFSDPEIIEAMRDREHVQVIVNHRGERPESGAESLFFVSRGHDDGSLMHHKFLVGFERIGGLMQPVAVWTGSFNFTISAEYHWENAMIVKSQSLACLYYAEFLRVARLGVELWPKLFWLDQKRLRAAEAAEYERRVSYVRPEAAVPADCYSDDFASGFFAFAAQRPCPFSYGRRLEAWKAGFEQARQLGPLLPLFRPNDSSQWHSTVYGWYWDEVLWSLEAGAEAARSGRKCRFRRPDRVQAWNVGYAEAHRLMNEQPEA